MLGLLQISQQVLTKVSKAGALRQIAPDQFLSGGAKEGLPAMSGSTQPGAPVNRRAVVVSLPQVGLARVQGHPHQQGSGRRPLFSIEGCVEGCGSGCRIPGPGEDGKPAVTLTAWAHQDP